jgi:hypothetical protein
MQATLIGRFGKECFVTTHVACHEDLNDDGADPPIGCHVGL